jgi:GT2 family glycosyltransferase
VVTLNKPQEVFSYEHKSASNLNIITLRNGVPIGFGANHNQAFKYCKTKWFAILNPDLLLPNDVFSPLIQAAEGRCASLAVPHIVNPLGHTEDSIRFNLTPWSLIKRFLKVASQPPIKQKRFSWFAGMFYLVDSSAYREIGGFDERFFLYCEDYDFCARLFLNGYTAVFHADVLVVHDARRSSRKSTAYFLKHLKSMLKVWSSSIVWRISFINIFDRNRLINWCK